MGRKHKGSARAASTNTQASEPRPVAEPSSRRKILYGLITVSVAAIAVGIYLSQATTRAVDARAASFETRQSASGGALGSIAPFYNFGSVSMAAGNVMHRYTISNTSPVPVTITKLSTSCMCTVATLVTASGRRGPFGMPGHGTFPTIRERLAPGEMAQVDVVFDPAAHGPAGVGRIERAITVQSDAAAPLQLTFTAMVRP